MKMKTNAKKDAVLLLMGLVFSVFLSCSSGNLDYVKEKGPEKWKEIGFETSGYEGYEWGFWGFGSYGGARVWWRLKKIPDNNITYSGFIQRWGNELHIYGPVAIDAIKPRQ